VPSSCWCQALCGHSSTAKIEWWAAAAAHLQPVPQVHKPRLLLQYVKHVSGFVTSQHVQGPCSRHHCSPQPFVLFMWNKRGNKAAATAAPKINARGRAAAAAAAVQAHHGTLWDILQVVPCRHLSRVWAVPGTAPPTCEVRPPMADNTHRQHQCFQTPPQSVPAAQVDSMLSQLPAGAGSC
jgi:hypothetical protein